VLDRHERFCNLSRVEHDVRGGITVDLAVDLAVEPVYDGRGHHLVDVHLRRFCHHHNDCAGFHHDVDPSR
jgi:hypothetical protein